MQAKTNVLALFVHIELSVDIFYKIGGEVKV